MMKNLVIPLVLLLSNSLVIAQEELLTFNTVPGVEGNRIGKVTAIGQDSLGFMWFAGQEKGWLYRYDGVRTIAYRHDVMDPNSMGGNSIETLFVEPSGVVWISTGIGIDRLDPTTGKFKHFVYQASNAEGLASPEVNVILKDSKGRLWIGTSNGLDEFDADQEKFIHHKNDPDDPSSLSDDVVRAIYEDKQGTIWIGTGFPFFSGALSPSGGLNRLNPDGSFTRYLHDPENPRSLINNKVRSIFEDSRGVFWVGTSNDGLHTMNRQTGEFQRHTYDPKNLGKLSRPPLPKEKWPHDNDHITFIIEDRAGMIWIATMLSGINRYNPLTGKVVHYESSYGFPDKSGWTAFASKDGVLWFSTQQDNLFRVDLGQKRLVNNVIGDYESITGITEDRHGFYWMGAKGKGLYKLNPSRQPVDHFIRDPKDSTSLFHDWVITVYQDEGDTLWIGTGGGFGLMNQQTGKFYRAPVKFPSGSNGQRCIRMIRDSHGEMWFCTSEGLVRFNRKTGTWKLYQHDPADPASLSSDALIWLLEDSQQKLWIGTHGGGLERFNRETGKFDHYLSGAAVTYLFEDASHIIWIGTSGGLYWFNRDKDAIFPVNTRTVLNHEGIVGIGEDRGNNLWISMYQSIVKLSPSRNQAFVYGSRFGISGVTPGSFYRRDNDEILVGNDNGYYSFSPAELVIQPLPLQVLITDFEINNISVRYKGDSMSFDRIEDLSRVTLNYNQNTISLGFSLSDYRAPEDNYFVTRLEGADNVWREASQDNRVSYFDLKPGTYLFSIRAYASDGAQYDKSLAIRILPPWWKTWYAYTTYLTVFIGMGYVVFRVQKQRIIQQERQRIQQKELEQAKKMEKAYHDLRSTQAQLIQSEKMASLGELTAGIAHEIQNPLNFVNNFSEVNTELLSEMKSAILDNKKDEAIELANDIEENEKKINHHGRRADEIVKGMLQHSRTSSGTKELTDINALADEYLRLAYHGLRAKDKSFNATMKSDFDPAVGKINVVPQDIGRVILNLISNAFYVVNEKRRTSTEFEPTVTIITRRNGNKIEIKVKDNGNGIPSHVIDKIFQPFFTTKPTGQGTGLGLSLSYDIVKAHMGEIKLETKQGEGTEFIVQLPA